MNGTNHLIGIFQRTRCLYKTIDTSGGDTVIEALLTAISSSTKGVFECEQLDELCHGFPG